MSEDERLSRDLVAVMIVVIVVVMLACGYVALWMR